MNSNGIIFPVTTACMIFNLVSCDSNPKLKIPNRLPTFAVKGTILIDGDPVGFVTVKFNPATPQDRGGYQTSGVTDDVGRITVSTYGLGDGAPAGEYVLTFSKREKYVDGSDGPDALNGRYESTQRSPHRIVIANGPFDFGEIKLTTN
jgi:hypothetical protein